MFTGSASQPAGIALDIGCGADKVPGSIGVDRLRLPGVNVICDIEKGLPFRDGTVARAYCIHVVEHIRELAAFMEELYRVCSAGARVTVKTPYYASREAFQDPTHVRFMTEHTFHYFGHMNLYGFKANFRTVSTSYRMRSFFRYLPKFLQRPCRRHLWNACEEMAVVLEAVKP